MLRSLVEKLLECCMKVMRGKERRGEEVTDLGASHEISGHPKYRQSIESLKLVHGEALRL